MANIKKLTLLHSNDMHGDFLPKEKDGKKTGGISYLSGYIKKVRAEEKNVLYANAGDLFRGSVIDSEYRGLSTVELVDLLAPDVVTVGNHEVDYGIAHLLFLEKCARFPIINANLYIKSNHARLFEPYKVIDIDGIKVMFIGIITEEVLAATKAEPIIGSFVDVWEAASQVGAIIDNYKTDKIDLTVLLTHIGYDEDKKLAELLDPNWGVDLIIGSHSHTLLKTPKVVNGVPIVQAGSGTANIGRFDLEIDTDEHTVTKCDWRADEINEDTAQPDPVMESVLQIYKSEADEKYSRILTVLKRQLTHPTRSAETELGNLFADLMQQDSSFDIMLFGAGTLRGKKLGPVVTYKDLKELIPFVNPIYMMTVTGSQFKRMCCFYIGESIRTGGSSEFYDVSKGVMLTYDAKTGDLTGCSVNGRPVQDDDRIKIAMQEFHYNSFEKNFGFPVDEVLRNGKARMVVTSDFSVYEEFLTTSSELDAAVEGRITVIN
ncbi:MAG: 5'-nucleotidase C-terminal domain-containing protein [Clostridia bacterium]|nr:5'-nucleotidase C-terminal domain-containing protein [Clostridia bacterium]